MEKRGDLDRETSLRVILLATLILSGLALINAIIHLVPLGNHHYLARFGINALVFAFVFLVYKLRKHYKLAVFSVIMIYYLAATGVAYRWGYGIPSSVMLFAFVIVLSGFLLGSGYLIAALLLIGTTMLTLTLGSQYNLFSPPDVSWAMNPQSLYDVFTLTGMLAFISTVTWLFIHNLQKSISRTQRSEKALKRQKALLAVKVEHRTRQFQLAQVEKMKQLYRFAELGHITTALFHDLASRLSALSLDVDNLGSSRQNRADLIKQTHESIDYIDDMVRQVRIQIQGQAPHKYFKLLDELSEVAQTLNYKAIKQKVKIEQRVNIPPRTNYFGDPIGFRQMISNILSNSIDSYSGARAGKTHRGTVTILIDKTASDIIITFSDQGRGINKNDLAKIFEPFFTTKKQGMGIGLFISKQLAEKQFKGKLLVTSAVGKGTTFTLLLPKIKRKKG